MDKWKAGTLKSGGSGKPVSGQKQAVAIMLSEKRAAQGGKKEYMKKQSGGTFIRSAMGRKVIHHSPDKHPEQGDPVSAQDQKDYEDAMRQMQGKPPAQPTPKPIPTSPASSGDEDLGIYKKGTKPPAGGYYKLPWSK